MIIPTDRHDEEPMILERVRRDERIGHYETVRQRKDGSLVDISITVSPIKDEKGEIIGAAFPTGDHAVEVFRKDCVIRRFYDSRVVLRGAIAR